MKNQIKKLALCSVIVAAAVVGLATPAFAQDTAPPPPSSTAPVRRAGRTSGDVVANGGLGVGATMFVSGLSGPEVVYDFGLWHLSGMLGFDHEHVGAGPNADTSTTFDFGVGGWYHLHLGESSDFSLGGSFGLLTVSGPGNYSATGFEFEPGAQMRVFLTPNVALHAGVAFVLAFGDYVEVLHKPFSLDGQITENFGFTYFFR